MTVQSPDQAPPQVALVAADRPPAPAAGARPWTSFDRWVLGSLIVLLLVTQRLGIQVGDTSVSFALPISYLAIGVLLVRGRLRHSRVRAELFVLAFGACLVATTLVALNGGRFSMPSLLLLLAVYLPWTLRASGAAGQEVLHVAGTVFVSAMLVLAVAGVGQLVGQLSGLWTYTDYLGDLLPPNLEFLGYNTNIPLVYGSATFKANGFVLSEPSFLSQFCALAVLVALMMRQRAWKILVLLAGLASAVSGTGILLLVAGVVLLVVRARERIRPAYVIAATVVVLVVVLGPTGALLLGRSDEVVVPGSSGNSRFVAPYTQALTQLGNDPDLYLRGAGPGMAYSLSNLIGPLQANYTILPKLVLEYGLIAGGLFALFVLICLLDGVAWRVVPGAVVVMLFFLSGALLQPQTAFLAWILTGLGAVDRVVARPARRRSHRGVPVPVTGMTAS